MAINETISTGNKYRRLKDASTKLWQRLSFWTKASDVEFDNGATAETSLGNIQGITDSVNSNASNIAASAAAVNTLNSNITVYVGDDGKIHFKNGSGADTVLNFKSYQEGYKDGYTNGLENGDKIHTVKCDVLHDYANDRNGLVVSVDGKGIHGEYGPWQARSYTFEV